MWHLFQFTCVIIVYFELCGRCESQQNSPDPNQLFVSHHESLTNSPPLLRSLAEQEEIMVILMRNYMENHPGESHHHILIKDYLEYFNDTTGRFSEISTGQFSDASYRPNNVAWTILGVFHMIKRVLRSAKEIVLNLDSHDGNQYALQRQLLLTMGTIGWPREEDFEAVMDAILRLQLVHGFKSLDISNGIIDGLDTKIDMSPYDCLEMGYYAVKVYNYCDAVEWLELAQLKFSEHTEEMDETFLNSTKEHLIHTMEWVCYKRHDKWWNGSEPWDVRYCTEKIKGLSPDLRHKRRDGQLELWRGRKEPNFGQINYWGLCAGENHQDEDEKSKLFCWYETEINFVWKIKPLKAELLSINPLIVQYYDVIKNDMMKKVKRETAPYLGRSTVLDNNVSTRSLARTSSNTWIDDHSRDEYLSLPKVVELITGLNVQKPSSSERVQVASYTVGGHYGAHLDALYPSMELEKLRPMGDRLATFIYYLSDVEKGGETAFVQAGIASKPIKGSAVLWFNLLRSGELDVHTWHGACPVIQGEKWISNKWILSHDQMFVPQYKCAVEDQNARNYIKVNGKDLTEIVDTFVNTFE